MLNAPAKYSFVLMDKLLITRSSTQNVHFMVILQHQIIIPQKHIFTIIYHTSYKYIILIKLTEMYILVSIKTLMPIIIKLENYLRLCFYRITLHIWKRRSYCSRNFMRRVWTTSLAFITPLLPKTFFKFRHH